MNRERVVAAPFRARMKDRRLKPAATCYLLSAVCLLLAACWLYADRGEAFKHLEAWDFEAAEHSIQTEETVWLKGLLAFYQGRYEEAVALLESEANRQGSREYLDFSQFAKTTRERTRLLSPYTTTHFTLYLSEQDSLLREEAFLALEKAYERIGKLLKYFPKEKIRVEIFPTADDFEACSSLTRNEIETSGAIGICKFGKIMLNSPVNLAYGYRWMDALAHEYTHYLIQRLSQGGSPLWLHEGVAKYSETLWRLEKPRFLSPASSNLLLKAAREGMLISFDRMSPSLVKLKTSEEVSLAFAEVAVMVNYLVEKYGATALSLFLRTLGETEDKTLAMRRALNTSPRDLESQLPASIGRLPLAPTAGAILDSFKIKGGLTDDEVEEFVSSQARRYVRLSDRYRQRQKWTLSLYEIEKAEKLEPHNPVILNKKARILLHEKLERQAEEALLKARDSNPNWGPTYALLGEFYIKRKEFENARKSFEEYIQLNPFNPNVRLGLAQAYEALGEKAKSEREMIIYATLMGGR